MVVVAGLPPLFGYPLAAVLAVSAAVLSRPGGRWPLERVSWALLALAVAGLVLAVSSDRVFAAVVALILLGPLILQDAR